MAFYTPHGLKIRFDIPYAFTLLSRLYPEERPEKVLYLTEGLVSLPVANAYLLMLIGLSLRVTITQTLILGIAGTIIGLLILFYGLFLIPGEPTLGLVFSKIPVFIRYAAFLLLIYVLQDWTGVVVFIGGSILRLVIENALEFLLVQGRYKKTNIPFTLSEYAFINAYRLIATKHNLSTDIDVSEDELEIGLWESVAEAYSEIVA